MNRRRTSYALLAAGAILLSGCTSDPPSERISPSPPLATNAIPSDSDIEAYTALSCAELIAADLAHTLNTSGFTSSAPQPWTAQEVAFEEGVVCEWNDGSDSEPTVFGWAMASEDEIEAAHRQLDDQGWTHEQQEGDVVYLSPDSPDTYIFNADREVRFGSTQDGARAVIDPPS